MSDASDVLELAKKRYKVAVEGWREVYTFAKADLDFMSDKPGAQWDDKEFSNRQQVGRPAPQIDQLTQFKHQVVNDIRMNTPTINVIPSNLDSDPETAEMLSGRIKAIEYKSNADSAYDTAVDFSVGCSVGFIRVDRQYVDDESFDQELCIKRVVNPLAIYIDPNSIEPDGSDAKYGFVIQEISIDDFKKKWPDANPVTFGDSSFIESSQTMASDAMINIVEYFTIDEDEQEYGLMPDGSKEPVEKKKNYQNTRKIKKRTVKHYKMSGEDVLEETTFPGKYIPLVPVYGEERWNDGKRHIQSLIRRAKDAQRTYNLWKGLETELLLKQQQAPVQAAVGQMRGFEDDWSDPAKAMVLYYHQTDINGQPAGAPQRLQPPTIPTGIVNASQGASNNIREILGMYNASAGKREGDISGIALKQLEQSGDVGNYHFGDNLMKSITHVGKIIVCALPEIEDTSRVVSIIDKEEKPKMVGINGEMVPEQERRYDMGKGKYDVRVVVGASFTTQRQQAAELYQNTLKILPPEAAINVLDLVFKYQDTPGAQALESRFKKMVDPKFLDAKDREEGQPDPQVQALTQQIQQLQAEAQQVIATLQQQLQEKGQEMQIANEANQLKLAEIQVKEIEAQAKLAAAQKPDTPVDNRLALDEIRIKAFEVEQAAKNETLDRLIQLQNLRLEFLKVSEETEKDEQETGEMEETSAEDMQKNMLLADIGMKIDQLTAVINQPIVFQHDAAGNIIGAQ
jgi:hypothetical protein